MRIVSVLCSAIVLSFEIALVSTADPPKIQLRNFKQLSIVAWNGSPCIKVGTAIGRVAKPSSTHGHDGPRGYRTADGRKHGPRRKVPPTYSTNSDLLMRYSQPNGLITDPHGETGENGGYMYGHGFCLLFLTQLIGEEEDQERRQRLEDVITRAVDFTCKAHDLSAVGVTAQQKTLPHPAKMGWGPGIRRRIYYHYTNPGITSSPQRWHPSAQRCHR